MWWMLVSAVLSSSPAPTFAAAPAVTHAAFLAPTVQTGTLIFSRGDCLAVKIYTQSPYTHVAAVVIRNGQPFVYDSANGVGVRCQTLARYLASQGETDVHVLQPRTAFSAEQCDALQTSLDQHLGRPYGITHFVSGDPADGLHCSEYVTTALMDCRLLKAKQPARVSPASLLEGITRSQLYDTAHTVRLVRESPAPNAPNAGRCAQLWTDTKHCTYGCYSKLRGWFLCD